MGNLTVANFSPDMVSLQSAQKVSGLLAGVALTAGDLVYLDSDGTVKKAVSTQCTISNIPDFLGVCPADVAAGRPVTVLGRGARVRISSSLTPGAFYWVSATAGALSTTKVASADVPCAIAIDATDILIIK
jgi:hypothetical protein